MGAMSAYAEDRSRRSLLTQSTIPGPRRLARRTRNSLMASLGSKQVLFRDRAMPDPLHAVLVHVARHRDSPVWPAVAVDVASYPSRYVLGVGRSFVSARLFPQSLPVLPSCIHVLPRVMHQSRSWTLSEDVDLPNSQIPGNPSSNHLPSPRLT